MPAPRAPQPPPTPQRPRLRAFRPGASAELDDREVRPRGEREAVPVPQFIRFADFKRWLGGHWQAGEHVSLVGQTGSGKTTVLRELLDLRSYVVVIGTKRTDTSLYEPLQQKGYVITDEFDPRSWDAEEHPKLVFRCPLSDPSQKAEERQREAIRVVLRGVYITGGWTLALDEVGYLSRDLKLDRELNAIWREGRSAGTTLVAGTQRPVNVPRNMWEMSTHLVAFRVTGREDRLTAASYLGELQGVAFETMAVLPRFEFLYADSVNAIALRSRVEL